MPSIRSTRAMAAFRHSFNAPSVGANRRVGSCRMVVEEMVVDGVSIMAHRRVGTMLHFPAIGANAASKQVYVIEPHELEAAMRVDAREMEPMESCC